MCVAAKLLVSSYGDWPILLLCQIDVTKSARHEPFVDGRIARMCQNLIDAPAGHYIATQKQLDFAQVQPPYGRSGFVITIGHAPAHNTRRQPVCGSSSRRGTHAEVIAKPSRCQAGHLF